MSDLRRHGRELLDASRSERTPSQQVKEQLIASLLEAAAQAALPAGEALPLASRLSRSGKALVLALLALAIGLGIYLAGRP